MTTVSAFLVKGPVALFVLTAPLFVALIRPPPTARALAGYLSVYLVAVALGGAALWLHPPTAEMLDAYFHRHVYSSVDYSQGFCSDGKCLYILGELFTMLSVPLVAGMVLLLFLRCRPSRGWWRPVLPAATGHMLIGISASFPIVLSTKQSSHYLLPSLPFYMLGLGLLLAAALSASDRVDRVLKRRPSPSFLLGVAILAVAVVVWSWSRVGTVRKSGSITTTSIGLPRSRARAGQSGFTRACTPTGTCTTSPGAIIGSSWTRSLKGNAGCCWIRLWTRQSEMTGHGFPSTPGAGSYTGGADAVSCRMVGQLPASAADSGRTYSLNTDRIA